MDRGSHFSSDAHALNAGPKLVGGFRRRIEQMIVAGAGEDAAGAEVAKGSQKGVGPNY